MLKRSRKQSPEDTNQITFRVRHEATSEARPKVVAKNPAAVQLGRLGGLKGGKARAASLSPEKRSEIAKKAAVARWEKRNDR